MDSGHAYVYFPSGHETQPIWLRLSRHFIAAPKMPSEFLFKCMGCGHCIAKAESELTEDEHAYLVSLGELQPRVKMMDVTTLQDKERKHEPEYKEKSDES